MRQMLSLLFRSAWVFTFLFVASISMAQEQAVELEKDFETWTSTSFSYAIDSRWKVDLNQQLRLKENSSQFDVYFTQLGVRYKFKNNISVGTGARYIRENDNQGKMQGYENHFRWNGDLMYKLPVQRFALKYRLRYQSKTELNIPDAVERTTYRFKTALSYNIKQSDFRPSLSAELFHNPNLENGISKVRYSIGTSYHFKKAGEIAAFYRIEDKRSVSEPKRTQIFGIKYQYTLKSKSR